VLWEYKKGTGYTPSSLLYGDYLYLVSDKGILTCLDPATGRVIYEGGRIPVATFVRASPVAWEDKILLGGEDGDFFVIRAGATHEVLSSNSIRESVTASPAIAGGMIFLRGQSHLYAIGSK
jgi:outer membrane protein assembly factor BamB